jgi:hypothetical protein
VREDEVRTLLDAGVLGGLDSLRYEENHYFDLAYLKHVPSRYMKVRYAYKVTDRTRPVECKFIHKIPIDGRDNIYRIKARVADDDDETRLLVTALQDREQHLQPVFTHNAISPDPAVTVLVKRYSTKLRTLSVMGPELRVRDVMAVLAKHIDVRVIPDPSNYRFVKRELSRDFEFETLRAEELALFRSYAVG